MGPGAGHARQLTPCAVHTQDAPRHLAEPVLGCIIADHPALRPLLLHSLDALQRRAARRAGLPLLLPRLGLQARGTEGPGAGLERCSSWQRHFACQMDSPNRPASLTALARSCNCSVEIHAAGCLRRASGHSPLLPPPPERCGPPLCLEAGCAALAHRSGCQVRPACRSRHP